MQDKQKDWRAALLAAAVLACSTNALAADEATGIWVAGSLTGSVGDDRPRWLYAAEAHARYFDLGSGINQWLLRPAVGYRINKDFRGWVGYSRYRTRNRAGDVATENRYWQQLDWKAGRIGAGDISLRGRLEQRDISVSSETRHVARLMLKYSRPLADSMPQSLILSTEAYFDLNTTDWGGATGLAQYRLYGGVEWRLGPRTTLETGYLHQHIEVESGIDLVNHLGILVIRTRLQ